jgi:hypothetical protein
MMIARIALSDLVWPIAGISVKAELEVFVDPH